MPIFSNLATKLLKKNQIKGNKSKQSLLRPLFFDI